MTADRSSYQDVFLTSYTAQLMRAARHFVEWFPGGNMPSESDVERLARLGIETGVFPENMARVIEDFGGGFALEHLTEIGELGLMTPRSVEAYYSLVDRLGGWEPLESHMKKYVDTLKDQREEVEGFRGLNGSSTRFELLPDVIVSPCVARAMRE